MEDFESPLDLDGDSNGYDAIEVGLFFDEEGKKKGGSNHPSGNCSCSIVLLVLVDQCQP